MINIVFLLLLFFPTVGQIATPLSREIALVDTNDMLPSPPPGGVFMHAGGRMLRNGETVNRADSLTTQNPDQVLRLGSRSKIARQYLVRTVREFRADRTRDIHHVTLRGSE